MNPTALLNGMFFLLIATVIPYMKYHYSKQIVELQPRSKVILRHPSRMLNRILTRILQKCFVHSSFFTYQEKPLLSQYTAPYDNLHTYRRVFGESSGNNWDGGKQPQRFLGERRVMYETVISPCSDQLNLALIIVF